MIIEPNIHNVCTYNIQESAAWLNRYTHQDHSYETNQVQTVHDCRVKLATNQKDNSEINTRTKYMNMK